VATSVRARALADTAMLDAFVDAPAGMEQAQRALAIARDVDDPGLLARALTACGFTASFSFNEIAREYFAEAIGLARALDDRWRLSQILTWQANGAVAAGDPIAARAAAEEGRDLADAIGDRFYSLQCRQSLGYAAQMQGDLVGAVAHFRTVAAEADAAHADIVKLGGLQGLGYSLACQGEVSAARAAGEAALEAASDLGEYFLGFGHAVLSMAALAAGDVVAAQDASEATWQVGPSPGWRPHNAPSTAPRQHWRPVISSQPAAGPTTRSRRRWAGFLWWH
jgi:tetratricopeptide (TPR) repeat protein